MKGYKNEEQNIIKSSKRLLRQFQGIAMKGYIMKAIQDWTVEDIYEYEADYEQA